MHSGVRSQFFVFLLFALLACLPLAGAMAQEGESGADKPTKGNGDAGEKADAGAAKSKPGLVRIDVVSIAPLSVPARPGNAKQALRRFLDAHRAHKADRLDPALRGYFQFLGMPGRHELPRRYVDAARERLDVLAQPTVKEYEKAARVYESDREAGLKALRALGARVPFLPAGRAAFELADTDALRAAIDGAKRVAKRDPKTAAQALEKSIRECAHGLFLYEAKQLLLKLGGPDLFEPGERLDKSNKREKDGTLQETEGEKEEPTIDIGGG